MALQKHVACCLAQFGVAHHERHDMRGCVQNGQTGGPQCVLCERCHVLMARTLFTGFSKVTDSGAAAAADHRR